jgi:hypothetical protein
MTARAIRLGADPAIRDTPYDGTAADWARHAHHDELAAWLQTTANQES